MKIDVKNSDKIKTKAEEVQDIINKMPRKTPRLIAIIVISLGSLLLYFGFLIKYPESVSGVKSSTANGKERSLYRFSPKTNGSVARTKAGKRRINSCLVIGKNI
ncbi:hypothetical protein EYV94_15345 [Puteibacter caeruleilacunae]|nr:hypothetical protein EYV94_15345 [Puteibacter caeruleilacunae]